MYVCVQTLEYECVCYVCVLVSMCAHICVYIYVCVCVRERACVCLRERISDSQPVTLDNFRGLNDPFTGFHILNIRYLHYDSYQYQNYSYEVTKKIILCLRVITT